MHWLMTGVSASFRVWPANVLIPALDPAATPYLLGTLDGVLRAGLLLAGPLLIAMVLAELGLALVGRFAPQLNIFDLSMSVKGLVFCVGLPLYAVFLTGYFRSALGPLADLVPVLRHLSGR
jgi:type III secretion protein T